MSDRLKALREQRGQIGVEMRALLDKAETEKRDLTGEELSKHGELFDKQDGLRKRIEAEERQVELDRQLATRQSEVEAEKRGKDGSGGGGDGGGGDVETRAMTAFRTYLRTGSVQGEGAEELRAMQAGSDIEGGYLVAPQVFVQGLLKNLDNAVYVRSKATKHALPSAVSLGVPKLDRDVDDAEWTTELKTGSNDDGLRFGKRELKPNPLAKRIKLSKKLLRVLPGIDGQVMSRLGHKFGVTQEKAFMLGNGAGQPLGLFTASTDGISTARDIVTGNTATAVTFDGAMEVILTKAMRDQVTEARILADAAGLGEAAERQAAAAAAVATAENKVLEAAKQSQLEDIAVQAIRNRTVADLDRETTYLDLRSGALVGGAAAIREAARAEYEHEQKLRLGNDALIEGTKAWAALQDIMKSYGANQGAKTTNSLAQDIGALDAEASKYRELLPVLQANTDATLELQIAETLAAKAREAGKTSIAAYVAENQTLVSSLKARAAAAKAAKDAYDATQQTRDYEKELATVKAQIAAAGLPDLMAEAFTSKQTITIKIDAEIADAQTGLQELQQQLAEMEADTENYNAAAAEGLQAEIAGIESSVAVLEQKKAAQLALVDAILQQKEALQDIQKWGQFGEDVAGAISDGMQSLLSGDSIEDVLANFSQKIQLAIFEALVADPLKDALKSLFSDLGKSLTGSSGSSSIFSSIFGSLFGSGDSGVNAAATDMWASGDLMAGVLHSGGIAGHNDNIRVRSTPPALFAGARRYHSGGVAGLMAGEVPAILQAGEEVVTADDPRHVRNGRGRGGVYAPQNIVINGNVSRDDVRRIQRSQNQLGAQLARAVEVTAQPRARTGSPPRVAQMA